MDESHVGERTPRPTNGLRSDGNGIMGNRITKSQDGGGRGLGGGVGGGVHDNNSSIWLMDVQERKKMSGQVFATTDTSPM